MANEAVIVYKESFPINFICSGAVAITKGTICKMADPMTASASTAASDTIAGIAFADKIANDGVTEIGIIRDGVAKCYLSGSCTIGDLLSTSATANFLMLATQITSGSKSIGTALQSGTTGQQILVDINIR